MIEDTKVPDVPTFLVNRGMAVTLHAADRWGAIDEMASALVNSALSPGLDPAQIKTLFHRREASMSTGIGRGLAFPHAMAGEVKAPCFCLGRSAKGIEWDSIDNVPVRVAILSLLPERSYQLWLRCLTGFGPVYYDPTGIDRLVEASDGDAIEVLRRILLKLPPLQETPAKPEAPKERRARVKLPFGDGIHARPAARIVKALRCNVDLTKTRVTVKEVTRSIRIGGQEVVTPGDEEEYEADEIMQLMAAALGSGSCFDVICRGDDADRALQAMRELFGGPSCPPEFDGATFTELPGPF